MKLSGSFLRIAAVALVLCLPAMKIVHAQDAAPAAAPAAAAPADAAAPAATAAPADAAAAAPAAPVPLNTGDTAWMLTSTALVLLMTVPGLALFYGGMEIGRAHV